MRNVVSSLLLFFMVSFYVFPSNSKLACYEVFHFSQDSVDHHFYVGLLVRLKSGEKKLLVGPYLGRGHQGLFTEARGVTEILWGGELKVQEDPYGIRVVKANETSGFVQELIEQEGVYPYEVELAKVENDIEALRTLENSGLIIDSSSDLQKYTADQEHLYDGLNAIQGNNRHDLGNKFQIIISYLGLMEMGLSLKQRQLRGLMGALEGVANYALAFEDTLFHRLSDSDRKTLKAFIEDSRQRQAQWRVEQSFSLSEVETLLALVDRIRPILLDSSGPATLYEL